ncbi:MULTISPECIES: hypothetical protein [Ignavibacterium]|uniref:hypothetical protein n=1 Tax=Ignavibacterium TaxID=795750 RepID=UPI0025C087D7|nr:MULTISPECIES: hypothetical protein [Ignavibacterium]MBI5661375.1 hypothetical protein [Ignavibacterium album]
MPLIEIINITLLAFSVGLLALMGISYLVYRYRESTNHPEIQNQIKPKDILITEKKVLQVEFNPDNNFRYPSDRSNLKQPHVQKEKYSVINKNIPSLRKTHSPKVISLVTSSSKK